MRYVDAVRNFKRELKVGAYDYWTVWERWSAYVDYLNKDGQITDKQAFNWATPFKYGKQIYVYENKIVTQRR